VKGFKRFEGFEALKKFRFVTAVLVVAGVLAAALGAQPAPRSFAWKASSPRGTLYLVGSVHLLTRDYYPLSPALENAFSQSALLVEEMNLGDALAPAAQMQALTRGLLPGNETVDGVLSPTTYARVGARAAALGIPVEPLRRFKPWMLALTLVELEWQKAGFDQAYGLDRHFYDRATADGKAIEGLETLDEQLSLFDGLTRDEQDHLLAESLDDADAELSSVTSLADAWKRGDLPSVERLVLADMKDDPELYRRLLVDRNRAWLSRLQALASRPARAFVVVGAAHLVGPDGLLAMLRAAGYSLQQL
jgi:uncharacterized protein YbaP (TraB family)